MERAERELRSRLADRLGGDDADRLAEIDELARGEVAAVAVGADAALRLAREHGADLDLLDAALLDLRGHVLVDEHVRLADRLARLGIDDVVDHHAAEDAVAERLDDLLAVLERLRIHSHDRAAVVLGDDDVLRDVDEAAGQVAGVGGLQRGVGETLARAVRRDEVLEHGEAFLEVGR